MVRDTCSDRVFVGFKEFGLGINTYFPLKKEALRIRFGKMCTVSSPHARERLTDRQQELRRLLSGLPASSGLRYADHLEQRRMFQRVCEMDLRDRELCVPKELQVNA